MHMVGLWQVRETNGSIDRSFNYSFTHSLPISIRSLYLCFFFLFSPHLCARRSGLVWLVFFSLIFSAARSYGPGTTVWGERHIRDLNLLGVPGFSCKYFYFCFYPFPFTSGLLGGRMDGWDGWMEQAVYRISYVMTAQVTTISSC